MKFINRFFVLCIVTLFTLHVSAKSIDAIQAQIVAQNFINQLNNQVLKRGETSTLTLAHTAATVKRGVNTPLYYVYNKYGHEGFVIIAADDNVMPILGYSDEKNFDANAIPPQFAYWLREYEKQITLVVNNNLVSLEAQEAWENYLANKLPNKRGVPTVVKPLLKSTWDQGKYYNDSCPYDNTAKKRTYTGCVATAMAQTMKYWSYPSTGTSSKTFTHATYGKLKANFANTTYAWNNMPNSVISSNMEVARLMYHSGVALSMNYGTNGSSAYNTYDPNYSVTPSTHFALQDYFGYDGTKISSVFKRNYNDQDWLTKMKTEINQGRVVIYEGNDGSTTGHCFVLDGYDANNFIHINWGWSGYYNGYFTFANLVPSGTGSGGGTGNYTSNQGAVIGITPKVASIPNVDFSASSTSTTVGNLLTLSDASTNYPSSWSWTISPNTVNFVNGTSSSSKFPEVTFSTPGKYTISLTVSNSIGSNSITKTNYVIVNPQLTAQVCDTITNVEADDTLYYYKVTGQVGFVSGNNSYSDLGCAELFKQPSSYTHISGVLIPFAYAKAANNTDEITLNIHGVTNNLPGTILATKNIKLADITSDVSSKKATRIQFDSPIAISGSYFVSVLYKYAAGDTVVVSTVVSGNAKTNTSFVKYSDGTFHPFTEAWSMNQHLNIQPLVSTLPTADFTITSSPTTINTNVNVDASSSVGAYNYTWTFSNASISTSSYYVESISYAAAGTYNVQLDVTGGCGNVKSITKSIVVSGSCSGAPATPGSITGKATVCQAETGITYSVTPVLGASSYSWTLPNGFVGTSTSNTIVLSAPNAVLSGTLQVQAVNSCGTSAASTLVLYAIQNALPSFTAVNPICSGETLTALPLNSSNSISGTWSPALDNTKTTTYTFTPSQGQCATTATMTITVTPNTLPSFTLVSPICAGKPLVALPTSSINSISGSWSPALDNSKTTTYTFTPSQGQCASIATMTITVIANKTPSFALVNPSCIGSPLNALPTNSLNSVTGTWSPALDNTKTTTYTFTPSQGFCANPTTMTIRIDTIPKMGVLSVSGVVCQGKTATISSTITGGVWSTNNSSIATVDLNGLVTFVAEGTVDIMYTIAKNSCTNSVSKSLTISNCLNLSEETKSSVKVFPNPSQEIVFIEADNTEFLKFDILDPLGEVVHSMNINAPKTSVNVEKFAAGIYMVRLYTNENQPIITYFNKN